MPVLATFAFPNLIIAHCELNGYSVLTNGLEAMRKYSPITQQVLPLVLRPFRQNLALTLAGFGTLVGDYMYRVVPYNQNEDEEGPCYPYDEDVAAYEITAVNNIVHIDRTALRRDSAEITHWRIYRTIAGGSWPVMALVATVPWATTTYNDNIADTALDFINEGINILIQVPVPKPFIRTHRSRVFAWGDVPYFDGHVTVTNGDATIVPIAPAVFGFHLEGKTFHAGTDARQYTIGEYNPTTGTMELEEVYTGTTGNKDYRICGDADTLIWSEPYWENEWPAANQCPIDKKEADKPAGLMLAGDAILLPKSRKTNIFYYNNNPAIPYSTVGILSTQYGAISHRSWAYVEGVPTWMSNHGLVQGSGGGVRLLSLDLGSYFEDNLKLDADGTQQWCCSVDLKKRGQFICFFPDLDSVLGCNRAIVWHYRENKFSIYKFDIEVTCAELVKNPDGEETVVLGDANGYLWEFPYGDADGPPAVGTVAGTVDSYIQGSPCALFDADAQFVDSGLGLEGMAVYIYEGTGAGQVAVIGGNSADTLFLQDCFPIPPDQTSKYYIGSIRAAYQTGWIDFGTLSRNKRLMNADLAFEKNDSDLRLNVYGDFASVPESLVDANPRIPVAQRTDSGIVRMDGDDEDAEHPRGRKHVPLGGIRKCHYSFELEDKKPRNPWTVLDLATGVEYKEPTG